MINPHPHADILTAIAKDKDVRIERLNTSLTWVPSDINTVFNYPDDQFRIKPVTIMVNGVECPAPLPERSGAWVSLSGSRRVDKTLWYTTQADADAVFAALVKPFGEVK